MVEWYSMYGVVAVERDQKLRGRALLLIANKKTRRPTTSCFPLITFLKNASKKNQTFRKCQGPGERRPWLRERE